MNGARSIFAAKRATRLSLGAADRGCLMTEETRQIKSKERVRNRGEVFTAPREVNAMLDLVKDETENIESTFLEPACGDGNFLVEVLRRKLSACLRKYGRSAADYEKQSFLACTTLYGVDIMSDNVVRCRERLFEIWEESFTPSLRSDFHEKVSAAVKYVFSRNILIGNALSMKVVDIFQQDLETPIVFTEWKFALGDKLKREEFRFDVLLGSGENAKKTMDTGQMTFFMDDADDAANWMIDPDDPERKRMIPSPSKSYPLIDYWRLGEE